MYRYPAGQERVDRLMAGVQEPLTDEQWRALATSSGWQERARAAVGWEGLSISLAKRLARDSDVRVRVALASRTATRPLPESVIADLYASPTPDVREALAASIQPLTRKQWDGFLADASNRIRLAFARSPRPMTEQETRDFLARSRDDAIAAFLTSARELPADVQIALAKGSDVSARFALAQYYGAKGTLCEDAHLILTLDPDHFVREAANAHINVDLLSYASGHDDPAVRSAASDYVISMAIGMRD